jgi:hypothetical protein
MRHDELRAGASHDQVAGQRQRERGAGRHAVDGGDHWLRAAAQRFDPAVQMVEGFGLLGHFLGAIFQQAVQVAAGRKEIVGAGQYHGANRLVALGRR